MKLHRLIQVEVVVEAAEAAAVAEALAVDAVAADKVYLEVI